MSMSDLLKAIKNRLSSDTQQNITLSSHKAPKSLSSKLPETSLWLELSSFLLDLLFDIWPLGCKTLALSSWNVTGASCQLPDILAWHTILLLCATRQKMQGNGLVLNSVSIKDGRHSWVLPTTTQQRKELIFEGQSSHYFKVLKLGLPFITCDAGWRNALTKAYNHIFSKSPYTIVFTSWSNADWIKKGGPLRDWILHLTCSNGQVVSCSFYKAQPDLLTLTRSDIIVQEEKQSHHFCFAQPA